MSDFTLKTYKDSYLYNRSDGSENLMKKHDTALLGFINKSERIDKQNAAFSGVVEDVKRQQTSSILYTVLMMPNVHLCINTVELPPAFKVFEAYDVKNDRRPAIFIDVTKLIIEKNGFYVCKNIGKLVTYLFDALTYLIYRKDPLKLLNNSAITINAVECYVSMFNYVIDYLRIIGYSANKERISYFVALFFLINMMGKDLDNYTKNLAAKTAKLTMSNLNALDLYMEEGMFDDIDSFITALATSFKLKGFTTEVFVQKWIYLYGNGSQYATELFTSFSVLLTNAFCGAYIVNQKQIEKSCGTSMVKYCNTLMIIGVDIFDMSAYMSQREKDDMLQRDIRSLQMAENLNMRNADTSDLEVTNEDFKDNMVLKRKVKANIAYYNRTNQLEKLIPMYEKALHKGLELMDQYCESGENLFEKDSIMTLLDGSDRILDDKEIRGITKTLESKIAKYNEAMDDSRESDPDLAQRYAVALLQLRHATNVI